MPKDEPPQTAYWTSCVIPFMTGFLGFTLFFVGFRVGEGVLIAGFVLVMITFVAIVVVILLSIYGFKKNKKLKAEWERKKEEIRQRDIHAAAWRQQQQQWQHHGNAPHPGPAGHPSSPANVAAVPVERAMTQKERLDKIAIMFKSSRRIKIDDVASLVDMPRKDLLDLLFSVHDQLDFMIDGDFLVIEKEGLNVFIDALDHHFDSWDKAVREKSGKL